MWDKEGREKTERKHLLFLNFFPSSFAVCKVRETLRKRKRWGEGRGRGEGGKELSYASHFENLAQERHSVVFTKVYRLT